MHDKISSCAPALNRMFIKQTHKMCCVSFKLYCLNFGCVICLSGCLIHVDKLSLMSMNHDPQVQGSQLVTHLVMVVIASGLKTVFAKPCFETGDFELCFLSKSAPKNEEVISAKAEAEVQQKYNIVFGKREMRDIFEDYHKNCTGCDDDSDVVDREDHVTQYLSELLVNTDSEITSLQGSDVEETREQPGGKDDGYFAFLTGEEKTFEVEGIWSEPAKTIVDESEFFY